MCASPEGAPLAQLDRATDYESVGREFESLRARHNFPYALAIEGLGSRADTTTGEGAPTGNSGETRARQFCTTVHLDQQRPPDWDVAFASTRAVAPWAKAGARHFFSCAKTASNASVRTKARHSLQGVAIHPELPSPFGTNLWCQLFQVIRSIWEGVPARVGGPPSVSAGLSLRSPSSIASDNTEDSQAVVTSSEMALLFRRDPTFAVLLEEFDIVFGAQVV